MNYKNSNICAKKHLFHKPKNANLKGVSVISFRNNNNNNSKKESVLVNCYY